MSRNHGLGWYLSLLDDLAYIPSTLASMMKGQPESIINTTHCVDNTIALRYIYPFLIGKRV